MKYKKIVAFGASVTEQSPGYVDALSKKLGKKIKRFGYAGICFIDDVITSNPDLCIIDWFSTGYVECTNKTLECIDTILYKFSKINCSLVFLFLPFNADTVIEQKKKIDFYVFLKMELTKRLVFFIDVKTEVDNLQVTDILRDSVHTTLYGGMVYANIISEYISGDRVRVLEPQAYEDNAKFKELKRTKVNEVFFDNMSFQIDGSIIGVMNIIGRHSGLCSVCYDNGTLKQVLLWDRWCHYERLHFDFNIPYYQGNIKINILQDNFDTSTCKLLVDFSRYKKEFVCITIFWQGNYLSLDKNPHGSKTRFRLVIFLSLLRKIKHAIGKIVKNYIH